MVNTRRALWPIALWSTNQHNDSLRLQLCTHGHTNWSGQHNIQHATQPFEHVKPPGQTLWSNPQPTPLQVEARRDLCLLYCCIATAAPGMHSLTQDMRLGILPLLRALTQCLRYGAPQCTSPVHNPQCTTPSVHTPVYISQCTYPSGLCPCMQLYRGYDPMHRSPM